MVPAGNKAKPLSSVNHTTKTIHHHRQVFSCEFCEISKNTFFAEHPRAVASANRVSGKVVIIDNCLQYLENLEVDKKKVPLSGLVESTGVTYVGEKQYSIDTLVRTFENFVLSQLT